MRSRVGVRGPGSEVFLGRYKEFLDELNGVVWETPAGPEWGLNTSVGTGSGVRAGGIRRPLKIWAGRDDVDEGIPGFRVGGRGGGDESRGGVASVGVGAIPGRDSKCRG